MRKLIGSAVASMAIGSAVLVFTIAIFSRVGTATERQRGGAQSGATAAPSSGQAVRPPAAASRPAAAMVDYERDVKPLLSENCLECHSQDKRKGGLSLANYDDVLEGGKDGAIVRPGSGARSMVIARVKGTLGDRMPLDELPLSDEQIALLERWIDQGARATPTSAAAPQPWEAPLALQEPSIPPLVWPAWKRPADRIVAAYLSKARPAEPALVGDAVFARRAYLDVWGLLPSKEELQSFVGDAAPDKRERLVRALLADDTKYAEHWLSFWNDLLRNEDGQTYYSEQNGRKSITEWLTQALAANMPYDRFVARLLNPSQPGDPEGFLIGVNWRGETSAAVTPWMQASQNTAQAFLGVNFKCNACHDSFVSKWKLKDAYGLAAYFSPEPKLQLYRCDIARDDYAVPSFFYPDLDRPAPSTSLTDRRATAAAIFTDARNGRMPRTVVNRLWTRLIGHGIVPNSDEMDGKPWSPALLDWLASDFVAHEYDVKHLIATIITSRAYQMPAVPRTREAPARNYAFRGPEVRRLTAEQFADAIGVMTGEWSVSNNAPLVIGAQAGQRAASAGPPASATPAAGRGSGPRTSSDAATSGYYVREYRNSSSQLTRALGRPIRDQVTSTRATEATTLQSLELVNGEILTAWLMRGARRMIGELPPDPLSRFNAAVAGRNATARAFDADISGASKLWIIVSDTGSNAPERVLPVFLKAEFVGPDGGVPMSSLTPIDASGLRPSTAVAPERVAVKNASRLVYDISGKGFTRFRGSFDVENSRAEIGSTLNPQLRFFLFDAEPNMSRLLPPAAGMPLPGRPPVLEIGAVVDHVFWSALGRAPSVAERQLAMAAITDRTRPGKPSPEGVADLLWVVLMKPEFQLIY
jgi:hypothetical protein